VLFALLPSPSYVRWGITMLPSFAYLLTSIRGDIKKLLRLLVPLYQSDEDINPYTGPATPTEPTPTSLPTTPNPETFQGPITRARARDLNYVILLRNEGEDSVQE